MWLKPNRVVCSHVLGYSAQFRGSGGSNVWVSLRKLRFTWPDKPSRRLWQIATDGLHISILAVFPDSPGPKVNTIGPALILQAYGYAAEECNRQVSRLVVPTKCVLEEQGRIQPCNRFVRSMPEYIFHPRLG